MALTIIKASSSRIDIELECSGVVERLWVDPKNPGLPGAISAQGKNGGCSLGHFRTRDGTKLQPDYVRLRKLCGFRVGGE